MDAGYATFLNLLQRQNDTLQTLPDTTIHGAIFHYLHVLPTQHIVPFVRALVASPTLWTTRKWAHLSGLKEAARSSVRSRYQTVKDTTPDGYLFSADLHTPLNQWITSIMDGLHALPTNSASTAQANVALLSGILLGLNDTKNDLDLVRSRTNVLAELVTSLKKAFDAQKYSWEVEFSGSKSDEPDSSTITICLLAQVIQVIPSSKLVSLDLQSICRLGMDTLSRAFDAGAFLSDLKDVPRGPDGRYNIPNDAPVAQRTEALVNRLEFNLVGPVCQVVARTLALLIDTSGPFQRSDGSWQLLTEIIGNLFDTSRTLEHDWRASTLSSLEKEDELAPSTQTLSLHLWQIFKTFLFSSVLTAQSIVSIVIFHTSPSQSPPAIAATILKALSHISFISSKFGGLTVDGGGFTEQKRTFFASLDIVSTDVTASEELLKYLAESDDGTLSVSHPVRQSRAAFLLACTEQLMPVVSEDTVESFILPFAKPFLSSPSHRETYEAAHSVLLAIFANNGKRALTAESHPSRRETLAIRLAPFYTTSLIKNTGEGKLSPHQLQFAYHALVRSATTSNDEALTWYCIERLLHAITTAKQSHPQSDANGLHALRLTLVSLISAVNTSLLPRLLKEVEEELVSFRSSKERSELAQVVQKEVMTHMGDAQKDIGIKWWFDLRSRLKNMQDGVQSSM